MISAPLLMPPVDVLPRGFAAGVCTRGVHEDTTTPELKIRPIVQACQQAKWS